MNIPFAIFLLVLVGVVGSVSAQIYKYKTQFVEKRNRELRLEQDVLDRVRAVEQRVANLETLLVARVEGKEYNRTR